MLGPWCQFASLSRGSGCLPSPYESQEICHQHNRARGSARWLSLVEVVNSSWLCHQHLGCQGHWCQPCSWAFCGEQHLHLNDGDSSLRSQLSGWGRGSLIPSPVGQRPYQVAAAPPPHTHTQLPLRAKVKKTQNSDGPAVSLSWPHPTRWLHSCRLVPPLSLYSSLLCPGKVDSSSQRGLGEDGPGHSIFTRSLTEACSPACSPLWSSRRLSLMSIHYRDNATVES